MTPYETAMRKIRRRWRDLDKADREEKRGQHGVFFTADELRALSILSSVDQARIRRLRKYIDMMENELSLFDYIKSRDQLRWERIKLRKKGDLLTVQSQWPWNE